MVVDSQVDPFKGNLLHADFKRIDLTKRIRVAIPVHTEGEPAGVKVQGGLLEVITRAVEIECLPDEIPESFTLRRQRADDRPEHARVEHRPLRLDEAGERAGSGDRALRGAARRRSCRACRRGRGSGSRRRDAAAGAAAEPEVIKKGKKEESRARRGEGQEEVARHVPGGRSGEPGRGVRASRRTTWVSSRWTGWRSGTASASPAGFQALVGSGRRSTGATVMLAKPQTFMNLSGTSLAPLMEKHSLAAADLVVVYDELDLPWTALRIKPQRSSAGHNGVDSAIAAWARAILCGCVWGFIRGHPLSSGIDICCRR